MCSSLIEIKDGWEKLCKQTDKQADRHYENNCHLAVNQYCLLNWTHTCYQLKLLFLAEWNEIMVEQMSQ